MGAGTAAMHMPLRLQLQLGHLHGLMAQEHVFLSSSLAQDFA